MRKRKNLVNGFAIVLVLSVIGLAATSISAIHSVKPVNEWLAATIGGKEVVTVSTFSDLLYIPQAHWIVIGLFALSTAASAFNYVSIQYWQLNEKEA